MIYLTKLLLSTQKFVIMQYGNGKTPFVSEIVVQAYTGNRKGVFCVQICNFCLCWYWNDNIVVFKFVIFDYAGHRCVHV